jgi:hypothetical protein
MSDIPPKWEELTPEQQAALVEFGQRFAEGLRKLADAFNALTAAAVEAHRQVEALGLMGETAPFVLDGDIPWVVEDDDTTPTPAGDNSP